MYFSSPKEILILILNIYNSQRNRSLIVVKFTLFQFPYLIMLKFLYPFLYMKINFLYFIMFPFFLVKSAFFVKLIVSYLLIRLIISLRIMDIIINCDIYCTNLVETSHYNFKNTNSGKDHTLLMHLSY